MAINLTSAITQLLTPEIIGQIASFLGIDRNAAQKAAGAAVPTILTSLSELAGTSAGASQLSKLLSQQEGSNPMDLLRNSGAEGLAQTGSNMLSGLFGGRTLNTMAQAIGRFAGMGDVGGKSLLGMIGPFVLGALGQHQRDAGLDANGLASLLRSQKDQMMAAIPAGLAHQLGSAGLIDRTEAGVRSGMSEAAAAGSRMANASGRAAVGAGQAALATATRTQWPYWLAALVVLGGLGWWALQRPSEPTVAGTTTVTRPATGTVGMAPPALMVDGVNLANKVNSSIDTLKITLPTITDAAGAQAALPKINDTIAQLDGVKAQAAKLSPDKRSALAQLIAAATPTINEMCDKVLATPGVAALAKPAIDDLRAKLDALAKA
jgi:uncharacterized protein DUF937